MSALSFRKKIIYTYLALFFALVTFAIALIECVALVSYDRPDIIPSGWSISIFAMHTVGFFLLLTGFIYSNESRSKRGIILSWVALGVSLTSFVFRVFVSMYFIDYRPASFRSS